MVSILNKALQIVVTAGLAVTLISGPLFAQEKPSVAGEQTQQSDTTAKPAAPPTPPAESKAKTNQLRDASASLHPAPLFLNLAEDQKNLWTSPLSLRLRDVVWLAPLVAVGTGLVVSDAQFSRHLNNSPSRLSSSGTLSNLGVGGLIGVGGGLYLWGSARHDDQLRETGILSGEAAVDTYAATELMKFTFGRQRPLEGDHQGRFGQGGQSFPSEHASVAWAVASVIAHEYPGPLTQLFAYGAASAVSAARITSKQHFPSDVLVGSALGWFVGQQVYRAHHDADIGLAKYGTFTRDGEGSREGVDMGSPYVPMDSWVYPAFDRLNAMGFVQSAFLGLRPWTRMECARLAQEADDLIGGGDETSEAHRLQQALAMEFRDETERLGGGRNFGASLDSVYTRWTGVSGKPLTDGYHFAQTIVNDNGRPYERGNNIISGFTSHAVAGPLAFYANGEYQHAPGDPNPIERPGGTIFADEFNLTTLAPKVPIPQADRLKLLEAYVAVNIKGWQASFGKQALWWGPGTNGPMIWSTNAEPVLMLKVTRPKPIELTGIFKFLGLMRSELIIGRLSGYHFVVSQDTAATHPPFLVGAFAKPLRNQPFINGQKVMFKPTPNLEFGITRTGILGGPNFPITTSAVLTSLFSARGVGPGLKQSGDRNTGFDFSYRIPYFRKWLILYNDSNAEDEINPIAYPRRSAMNPGIYMPQVPFVPKLDFRAEAAYTDLPGLLDTGFFYWDLRLVDGFTNRGNIMGDWVGREGRGLVLRSTYWLSPQSSLQFHFRKQGVDPVFLKGGTLYDWDSTATFALKDDLTVKASVQYERWNFPLLSTNRQSNVATSVQLTYTPKWMHWKSAP